MGTKSTKKAPRRKTLVHETTPAEAAARGAKSAKAPASKKIRDPRLPESGVIEKVYKGKTYRIEITPTGFRWDGRDWKSLTAIAREVTGAKAISGPLWAGIAPRAEKAPTETEATTPPVEVKKDGKSGSAKKARKTSRKGSAR
jgi:hypothetical protein